MLLALDLGNTNIHLGLWHDNTWHVNWRARAVQDKMPDEYAVLLGSFLRDKGFGWPAIRHVVMGSVVPPLTSAFVELTQRYVGVEPLVVSAHIKTGIKVDVDQPDQVGADRIVNAAAVHQLYNTPAIVIDFGTATTFDVVSREGNYIGGGVSPGGGLCIGALVGRTAARAQVTHQPP